MVKDGSVRYRCADSLSARPRGLPRAVADRSLRLSVLVLSVVMKNDIDQ